MTAPELKPCPFCGGEAEIWRAHEGRTAWIACMGKCVVLISKEYLSDDEAVAAWNRRADLAAVPAQVRVNPLVWSEVDGDEYAEVFGLVYLLLDPSSSDETNGWYVLEETTNTAIEADGSPEAAKAAAQADYKARIIAAIEPQPDPRDEVIKGLMEALEFYADEDTYETQYERLPCDCCTDIFEPINDDKGLKARAALAAAKAVRR